MHKENKNKLVDFKFEYKRGTGPGGQHKNKVESCVVVTHLPSGLTEKCEDTRSQAKNKQLALDRLKKRLAKLLENAIQEKINRERNILFKGRVRNYNFIRNEVKDYRTGKKALLSKILNGELELLNE